MCFLSLYIHIVVYMWVLCFAWGTEQSTRSLGVKSPRQLWTANVSAGTQTLVFWKAAKVLNRLVIFPVFIFPYLLQWINVHNWKLGKQVWNPWRRKTDLKQNRKYRNCPKLMFTGNSEAKTVTQGEIQTWHIQLLFRLWVRESLTPL